MKTKLLKENRTSERSLVRTEGDTTELWLLCPFVSPFGQAYCGEWCPHFGVKKLESRYTVVLSCGGTAREIILDEIA